MVDFSNITVSTLDFNTSMITDNEQMIPVMVDNANTVTEGYLGLGLLTVLFIVLTYANYKQDDDIRLDIVRSLLIASGFTSIIGIIAIVSGLITSFQHVVWFVLIFLINIIAVYFIKRKGG